MKRTRYNTLLLALLSILSLTTASAQQSQYALYNYRNDGDFNAWLNIDVDSITYSNIGLDSIEYDNIVTQEVWTPDSCYRIPIEAIDSIGFRAPAPEFKEGLFHITEAHIPYTVLVDSLSITFDSTLPTSMLPGIGQVVISDVYDEPFDAGFAGRVVNIIYKDGKTLIECEEVGLEDVYDQLIYVGKTIAYEDDDDIFSSRRQTPRKIKINEDGTIEMPLGKFSLTLKDGDIGYIKLNAKPTLNIDYTIVYNVKGAENQFRLVARPRIDFSVDYGIQLKKKKDIDEYLGFIPIETGIPGLRCKIRYGAFLDLSGSIGLEGSINYAAECSAGFDSKIDENHGFFYEHWSGWEEDPEVKIKMDGSIFMGPALQVFCYLIYEKGFPSVKFTVKPGLEFAGKFEASTDAISDYGFSAYDMLKDSKLSIGAKLKAESSANFFGKKFELPSYTLSPEWARFDWYLFPKFTKPELKNLMYANLNPTSLYSEVTRNTLFTTKLGMGVYDEFDNQVAADMSFGKYVDEPWTIYLGHDMSQYEPGIYTVRPLVNVLGHTFNASPVATFSVPEPMTLNINTPFNTVTLKKGQEGYYAINDGWGEYSASSSINDICSASIIEYNGQSYVKLVASKIIEGPATVTVKDLRAGTTKTILVTVSNEDEEDENTAPAGVEAIDLGLPSGTKWANMNVGATTPEGFGGYFAWGETSGKSVYDWYSYQYSDSYANCEHIGDNIAGTEYDVATAAWGSSWKMPTLEQYQELFDNTTSVWFTMNGVDGRLFTGSNGGFIFLPAAGNHADADLNGDGERGYYWSSSLKTGKERYAWGINFSETKQTTYDFGRYYGLSVRPVAK